MNTSFRPLNIRVPQEKTTKISIFIENNKKTSSEINMLSKKATINKAGVKYGIYT